MENTMYSGLKLPNKCSLPDEFDLGTNEWWRLTFLTVSERLPSPASRGLTSFFAVGNSWRVFLQLTGVGLPALGRSSPL